MAGGYIYVLANPSFADLYKIGCTTKDAFTRAAELYTTGVPSRFEVVFSYYVRDSVAEIEAEIHNTLALRRLSENREFFRFTSVDTCILDVVSVILEFEHTHKVHWEPACVQDVECGRCEMLGADAPSNVFRFLSDDEILTATQRIKELKDAVAAMSDEEKQSQIDFKRFDFELWSEVIERRAMSSLEAT